MRETTVSLLPAEFPFFWASDWGEDRAGLWAGVAVDDAYQRFRWIEPGSFVMGSPVQEADRGEDETQHEVTLSEGVWLADTPCIQSLWTVVMGENPSAFRDDDKPVDSVSFEDARAFLGRVNARFEGLNLRLPTEAEWEYGCRAGSARPFSFGDTITSEQVNYNGNFPYAGAKRGEYRERTVAAGSLPANAWGLYEMHGNVWEWCANWYGRYPPEGVVNPAGPDTGVERVLRGGSWYLHARDARSAQRDAYDPGDRSSRIGFRLARGQ